MPVIVALAVRSLIQFAVTLGVVELAEKFVLPVINRAIEKVMEVFGVSEETAQDITANEVVQFAEQVGVGALTLRTKIPTKIAERLGFTSKGFAKRNLTKEISQKVDSQKQALKTALTAGAEEAQEIAKQTALNRLLKVSVVSTVVLALSQVISLPTQFMYMIAQYIDYGNWPTGTFHTFFAKLLSALGLPENKPIPNSSVLSKDVWDRVYAAYRTLGAVGINDPFRNMTVPFSRENLIVIVDKVAATIAEEGGQTSLKNVLGATQGFVLLDSPASDKKIASALGESAPTPAVKSVKVFTGVVTQGTLGASVAFAGRPNDLITSVEELRQAAQNNLAAFLASLPGRIIYELKLVNSVTTKDGFTQRGSSQQVVVGVRKDGTERTKTVYNRFGVVNLFALTEKGTRTKLAQVVLGPVDALSVKPSNEELGDIETELQANLVTKDIGDINKIENTNPIEVVPPAPQPTPAAATPVPAQPAPAAALPSAVVVPGATLNLDLAELMRIAQERRTQFAYRFQNGVVIPAAVNPAQAAVVDMAGILTGATASPVPPEFVDAARGINPKPPLGTASAACIASTLSDWYSAQNQTLPPVAERAKLYASLALGVEAYYTGTAEQNTKLLAELKARAGCK